MAAVVLAAPTGGCGRPAAPGVPEEAFPVVANADLAVGWQRLLVGLVTADGASLAAADLPVEFDLSSEAVGLIHRDRHFPLDGPDFRVCTEQRRPLTGQGDGGSPPTVPEVPPAS